MKEVITTLIATAALFTMTVSLAGCAHLVPEKQSHMAAKAAVQNYFPDDEDTSMIVEGQNERADLLI